MKKFILTLAASLLSWGLFQPSLITPTQAAGHSVRIALHDSYGDGWNGNSIQVKIDGTAAHTVTAANNDSQRYGYNYDFIVPTNATVLFYFTRGSYLGEISFEILLNNVQQFAVITGQASSLPQAPNAFHQFITPTDGLPLLALDANGGQGSAVLHNQLDATITLPTTNFTRSYHRLLGFDSDSSATSPSHSLLSSNPLTFTGTGTDLTLYAIWEKEKTISFVSNGGLGETGSENQQDFYNGDPIDINEFTRLCYDFLGWSKDGGATIDYADGDTLADETDDLTLTAVWAATTQCLHFHPQGGTGWLASLPVNDGDTINLPEEIFIRPNFTFAGWAETPGGNIAYQPNDSFLFNSNDNQNLYAVWQYEKATEYAGTWGDPTFWEQDWYDDAANQSRYSDCINNNIKLGTKDCPYLIQTAGELAYLGAIQGEMAGTWFKLDPQGGTLDLSLHEWIPINIYGSEEGTIFTDSALAHLDGAGTTITGLKIKRLVPAVRVSTQGHCEQNFDAYCDNGIGGFFIRTGAAGLFGETYKLWTANYQLQAPEVTISAPSMIHNSDLNLEEEELFNACASETAAQAERCAVYGCGLAGLKDQISKLDLTLTCNVTDDECTYTDGTNYANIEKSSGGVRNLSLNYHYPDGAYALVEASCSTNYGCTYQYFEPGYEDEYDWSLSVDCDLTGQNCTFEFADGSDDLNCHGVGFSGLDNVGTLIGTGRYTRVTDVTVQNPNLQVANLTPGYTVGGMVGLAAGWTYLMTSRVEGGTLQVIEANPGNYQGTIRNKFFGGLVGLNYSSVIINGYTSSDLNYTFEEGAYSQLAKYITPMSIKNLNQTSITIGGLSGATDIGSPYGVLTTELGVCLMNSYSEAKITVRGDYLPHSQMVEPLTDGFWNDDVGEFTPSFTDVGGVVFRVGGIAAYINDTMVNNYFAGSIELLPGSTPEDLLDKLNAGTPLVKSTISGHSLEQMQAWDDALIANWNSMVKDWVIDATQNDGYPIFGTLSAPPTCPADKVDVNGECVCPTGEQENSSEVCIPCASDHLVNEQDQCVCPTGKQENSSKVCIPCASDHLIVNDVCVCPTGKQDIAGQCVCEADKQEVADGTCIDCASDHVIVADQCVCPTGEQEINGQCESIPVVFALPQPILEHQVTPENLYWNVLSLSPTMSNLTLRGYFEPDPGGPRPLNLTLKLLGQDYPASVTTSPTADIPFSFTIPITAFGAAKNNYLFLGPHQLTVTNPDTSETDTTDWNVSFYFPIYQADHDANWGGTFILSTNSKLNSTSQ